MQNDFNAARSLYLKAREIDKTDFRVNYGLGSAFLRIQFYQQALRYLEFAEQFVPADKASELRVRMAIAYRGTGARSKAKKYAQQAVDADPDDYTAQEVLAVAQVEDGEYDSALEHIDAMVRIANDRLADGPSEPGNIQFLISTLDRKLEVLNMYHLTMYEKDPTGKPTNRLNPGRESAAAASLLPLIDIELKKGELRKILRMHGVLPLVKRAVEYDPSNTEIWMRLGLLYVNTSQVDLAIGAFQKIIALDPNHASAAEHLALLEAPLSPAVGDGDPAAAIPSEP
jgi:tetratricopeptide (TPR) repeat protein